jgi:hypothetical protein
MNSKTKRNLPKGQDEKVVRAFGVVLECNIEDRDHPRCRLVNIMPLAESDGCKVHPVTHERRAHKLRRRSPIKEEQPEVEQDSDENPDDIEVLEESDGKLVDGVIDDKDELDEDTPNNESSDEDEEADEEEEEEQD